MMNYCFMLFMTEKAILEKEYGNIRRRKKASRLQVLEKEKLRIWQNSTK